MIFWRKPLEKVSHFFGKERWVGVANAKIIERENQFIADFNELDDWFLQYEYLLGITTQIGPYPPEKRTEDYRFKGCQSNVWICAEREEKGFRLLCRQ